MKIAIISDIHGNMQALNAVLSDIEKENADKIYCLGDLAMAGPEPSKTIDTIRKLINNGKVVSIQGNTDLMIANGNSALDNVKKVFPIMGNALEADLKEITDEQKSFLKSLPEKLEQTVENKKILFVHGSPRKNDENIFPDLPIEKVEEMVSSTDADIICCGHTHIPCGYQTNTNQTVVNAGSVGRPFLAEPKACWLLIEINNNEYDIQHKMTVYDKEKAAEILEKRVFDGSDKLAQMLLKPETRHA